MQGLLAYDSMRNKKYNSHAGRAQFAYREAAALVAERTRMMNEKP